LTGIRGNHIYLASKPITVYTDHISLKYLQTLKVSVNNRLARWALALQPYKFTTNYKEGKKLTAADEISRRPFAEPTEADADEIIAEDSYIAVIDVDSLTDVTDDVTPVTQRRWTKIHFDYEDENLTTSRRTNDQPSEMNAITDNLTDVQDIEYLHRQHPDFIPIFNYIEQRKLPVDDKAARKLILESENFVIEQGVLYHTFSPRSKRLDQMTPIVHQLCVPRTNREQLLRAYNVELCHIGQERLDNSLKAKYWFPLMYSSVMEYVRSCETCQKTKTSKHQKRAPLKPLEVVPAFCRVHIDFVGLLPETSDKYKHLLVIVDSSTFSHKAIPTKTTTAQILYREIICRYGAIQNLVTDGGLHSAIS